MCCRKLKITARLWSGSGRRCLISPKIRNSPSFVTESSGALSSHLSGPGSLREYLEYQGADMSGIVFSKQIFKAAYAAQIISDQQVWLDMLASRNITSHVYDDAQTAQIVADINNRSPYGFG